MRQKRDILAFPSDASTTIVVQDTSFYGHSHYDLMSTQRDPGVEALAIQDTQI